MVRKWVGGGEEKEMEEMKRGEGRETSTTVYITRSAKPVEQRA